MSDRERSRPGELDVLLSLVPPLRLRYCPVWPTPRQEAFLRIHEQEVFYGGAAAGGKTTALLMAALQYADVPGYNALLLRTSLTELHLAGGLIDLAHSWLANTNAQWAGETKTWRFPSGAQITFGYLSDATDLGRYSGTGYSMIGFDELSRFEEPLYRGMFRSLRQPTGDSNLGAAPDGTRLAQVPARIRSTSNPGGSHSAWIKDRFVDHETRAPGAVFLPSRMADNPYIDPQYAATLKNLPSAQYKRLADGDWNVPDDGDLFRAEWFHQIQPHELPTDGYTAVRAWDLAATEPSDRNRDPDWTVGVLLYHHQATKTYYIVDIVRERLGPGAVETLVRQTAEKDGATVAIYLEQEPGAAGVHAAHRYTRDLLAAYAAYARPVSGDKETRARPVAAAAQHGAIRIVRGRHSQAFLDELTMFPHGNHDDCIDALSAAYTNIHSRQSIPLHSHVPRGRIDRHNPARPGSQFGPPKEKKHNPIRTFFPY